VKSADASVGLFGLGDMRDNEGFDILHNGMPRTFRDQKALAYEAARFAKTQQPGDIIEIVDRSNGTKMLMLSDGRTA
jgi:hypothetical protein